MSGPEHDSDLAAAFRSLRRDEEEQCPPFAAVLAETQRSSRRTVSLRPALAAAAGIGLIVLAVWIGLQREAPRAREESQPSLAEWRSPTDFLLVTPGRELLASPAGLGHSILDVRPATAYEERRSPS